MIPWYRWLRYAFLLGCLVLAGCSFPGMIPPGQALPAAQATPSPTPLPGLSLPFDEGPHQDLTEWWYYTGHLQGTDAMGHAHTYGFELTFFQIARGDLTGYVGHYGLTDLTRGTYISQQQIVSDPNAVLRNESSPPDTGFNLQVNAWSMHGLNGHEQLTAAADDYALTLGLTSNKPGVALHNGDGLLTSFGIGFSYYYSRTHLQATGTLMDHGVSVPVTGIAWMDHQWGNFLIGPAISWDWFSVQLSTNVEYMVFFLNDRTSNTSYSGATRVAADGTSTPLTMGLAEVALHQWTSPTTHITYPSGWHLSVPDGQLTITPDLLNQEFVAQNASAGTSYWEGACTVTGTLKGQTVSGQSYVELTGRQASK
ncbi:MAG: carotenoid 1,2-hydratase [Ktedonobacterales bacterium]|nr:carotenoid 1,2-hydratase [Ktedonobacterales bacterium]